MRKKALVPCLIFKGPDRTGLYIYIFQCSGHRHMIVSDSFKLRAGEISAFRVADQHVCAALVQAFQPCGDLFGHVALIGDISGKNHIPALICPDQIGHTRLYAHMIGAGIFLHGDNGKFINITGKNPRRARHFAAIATNPEPEAKSSTVLLFTSAG